MFGIDIVQFVGFAGITAVATGVFFLGKEYGSDKKWKDEIQKRLDKEIDERLDKLEKNDREMTTTQAAHKAEIDEVASRFGTMLGGMATQVTSIGKAVEKLDSSIENAKQYFQKRIDKLVDDKKE